MGDEPPTARCILCESAMPAKRTIAREEPTLVCRPCKLRPAVERTALREGAYARVAAPSLDSLLDGYRRSNLRFSQPPVRRAPQLMARTLHEQAASARAEVRRARAALALAIARARVLLDRLDDLVPVEDIQPTPAGRRSTCPPPRSGLATPIHARAIGAFGAKRRGAPGRGSNGTFDRHRRPSERR
jgi:hypothetical protein